MLPEGRRVLLVDDDKLLRDALIFTLRQEGYDVVGAAGGHDGLTRAREQPFDLIILDVGLPDLNGFEVCRRLRQFTSAPVLMLTAHRSETDKVVGLDAGADDYLTKPFGSPELLARLRALQRRLRAAGGTGSALERIDLGPLCVDVSGHRVLVQGREIHLSPKEFALLRLLATYPGRALERRAIIDVVWGRDFFGDENALDVYIGQLRRKLRLAPGNPVAIDTVRGVGYRLVVAGVDDAGPDPESGSPSP